MTYTGVTLVLLKVRLNDLRLNCFAWTHYPVAAQHNNDQILFCRFVLIFRNHFCIVDLIVWKVGCSKWNGLAQKSSGVICDQKGTVIVFC